MKRTNVMLLSDGYKLSHRRMYPKGTTLVFSNFTPRSSKHAPKGAPTNGIIVSGVKKCLIDLHQNFEDFFKTPFDETVQELLDNYIGTEYDLTPFRDLHHLGYLPVEIRSLDEGSFCPIGVPFLTIHNTKPEFFWLTNFLETYISATLWKSSTCATIASGFYNTAKNWFEKTTGSSENMSFNVHNFSARGMDSVDAMIQADLGHLLYFNGSDTLPTIQALRDLYGVTAYMGGVPASEHSVMCSGGKEEELQTYSNLLDEFPEGFLSLVSDTWDLWNVITNILPQLKDKIMGRDGRLVIRPDSGNPVDILCGKIIKTIEADYYEEFLEFAQEELHEEISENTPHGEYGGNISDMFYFNGKLYQVTYSPNWNRYDKQYYFIDNYGNDNTTAIEVDSIPSDKGVVELLWDIFGGTINEQGYKVLDTHIGVIYGDSITIERQKEIYERLEAKGFAASNVVLGVGSYTYQYNTRDTFGMACKATYVEIDGNGRNIFKDPITDDGTKKSATGLLAVNSVKGAHGDSNSVLKQNCSWDDIYSEENLLKISYRDGGLYLLEDWSTITKRAQNNINRLQF